LGWSGPPYDPLQLASLLGIKHKTAEGLLTDEAQLTPLPNGQLLLEFNDSRSLGRRNFSVCHEIAHTFFPDCYEMVRRRSSAPARYDPDNELEQLCQVGAAELLMPEDDFRKDMEHVGLWLERITGLTTRYGASREAVFRRVMALTPHSAAIVFLSPHLSPSEKLDAQTPGLFPELAAAVKKMRVLYSVRSTSFSEYIPTDKSVPDGSCVYEAVHSGSVDDVYEAEEDWGVRNVRAWHVQAMLLPSAEEESADDIATAVALVQTGALGEVRGVVNDQ
jgi:hypothetical protein